MGIVLITGASKGIGRAFAQEFARNGYKDFILIARNEGELTSLANELSNNYQARAKILSVDLGKAESIKVIKEKFGEDFSHVEVLVNNAGFGFAKKLTDMRGEDIDAMLTVNIEVVTMLSYLILPYMSAKKGGKILNVASIASYIPGPYMAVYYATKAYVLSFSQAIAEEYAGNGVMVTAVCPGITKTGFLHSSGMEKSRLVKMPLFSGMTAEAVAKKGYAGLMKGKRVVVTGWVNKLAVLVMRMTPNGLAVKLTGKLQKLKM